VFNNKIIRPTNTLLPSHPLLILLKHQTISLNSHNILNNILINNIPNNHMEYSTTFLEISAKSSLGLDDISSLRNFLCNLITFWSSQGNLCSKKSRKTEENTKNENVSRFNKNVTQFWKTKTCSRH